MNVCSTVQNSTKNQDLEQQSFSTITDNEVACNPQQVDYNNNIHTIRDQEASLPSLYLSLE
jgi:hypothetical protein